MLPSVALAQTVDTEWLRLLHYQGNGTHYKSLVENESFFLAPDGRNNPQAELEKTIELFANEKNEKKCTFPARFMYLQKKGLVKGNLKHCNEYQKFLADVQPKAVTMLFTNAYMSNPSSLFGHTLFRIDTKRKGTQLLAHGANFGADTGDESGVLYALKGLWGGYYGTFGVHPYYDVINLYNNIENRDIWEYQLNFDEKELHLFTAHMWEMQNAKIKYYFASKNCSYVLLLMLEAVKPELNISNEFEFYTVPLATLKAVDAVPNFITHTNYRPSRQSKLKYRAEQMNKKQYQAFIDIIKHDEVNLNALSDDEKADVLETAYQYVQYKYVERDLELKDYRKKSFKLLRERSKIANQKQYFDELKHGQNPIEAHEAKQISLMFGAQNGKEFQEISFKPVYNSLMDDSYGLLRGAEINLLETKIRHETHKVLLQELNLLQIKSISGANEMFSPLSYDIKVAYEEIFDPKKDENKGVMLFHVGGGQSYDVTKNLSLYVLTEPLAAYSGGFRDNGYLGIGFKGGMYYNKDKIRFHLNAMHTVATNYIARGQTYELEWAYGVTRNVSIYAKYKLFNSEYHDNEEISAGIKYNF